MCGGGGGGGGGRGNSEGEEEEDGAQAYFFALLQMICKVSCFTNDFQKVTTLKELYMKLFEVDDFCHLKAFSPFRQYYSFRAKDLSSKMVSISPA